MYEFARERKLELGYVNDKLLVYLFGVEKAKLRVKEKKPSPMFLVCFIGCSVICDNTTLGTRVRWSG